MAVGTTAFPTSLDTAVELVEITNNASSTLSGNVLIGDTTIGVTDIGEFPTTGFGTMVDDLTTPTKVEIISWTGKSGSNLTGCTRGTQGTSAAAFSSGNYIEVRPTAGHHEALRGAVIAIETKIGTGAAIAVNKLAALTASRLMVTDASGFASAASVTATEAGYLSGVTSAIQTQLNAKGAGDVVGPASATGDAVARFDSTTGKLVKNSVVTIADTTGNMAGVGTLNTHTIPGGTDTFVLLTANQTLTTKTLTSPDINGGTADSLTSLSVRSTGAAFDLLFANTEVLTGNKTLTFTVNDTSRTVDLGGNLTLAAAFSTSGANALTLTTTGATNVTLPTTGTLVNSAVTSLSSLTTVGTITSGGLGTGAVIGGVTMTLGSDADGDMYYRASGVLTRLAKGTALQQLRMNAGATAPEWATISGGGLTIGTTAITSGTVGRMLYEASGNVVGEAAGITYQTGASPTATITAQAASYVGLRINSAATPSVNIFETTVNGGAGTGFVVTSTGAPSSPGAAGSTTSERYGQSSTANTDRGTAIGAASNASAAAGTAIGYSTLAGTAAVAIGAEANAGSGNTSSTVVGYQGRGGDRVTAIGFQAGKSIYSADNTWVGYLAGPDVNTWTGSVALGNQSIVTASNQFVSGSSSWPITNIFFGKGVTNATPTAYTINGTGGSGSNIAGADINIAGGKGTGTGATGKVNLQIARPGSTGSSLNALATAWSLNGTATSTDTTMTGGNGQTTVTGSLSESITLSTSGTTTDSTIDLPANSIILSVTGRVTTTITTATDWKLGDATIADRFSDANATLTANTTTVGINQWKADRTTAGQGAFQQSTAKVRITTTGTPGAGVIRITVHYITLSAPTS